MKICWCFLVVLSVSCLVAAKPPARRPAAPASEPEKSEREQAVRQALKWLIQTIDSKEWDEESEETANIAIMRHITKLMTAWLLEINPQFEDLNAERRRFRTLADKLVGEKLDSFEASLSANWRQGFAALYVYDRSLRTGKVHPALDGLARSFVKRQNEENGWSHGVPVNTGGAYPTTLIATTNLALFTLGAAKREKTPFTKEESYKKTVDEGLEMLREVQDEGGGMPYGGPSYKQAVEAGRTAAMLVALVSRVRNSLNKWTSSCVPRWDW